MSTNHNLLAVRQGIKQVIGWDKADKDAGVTLSGNFNEVAAGAVADQGSSGVLGHVTGKWYCEQVFGAAVSGGDTGCCWAKVGTTRAALGSNGAGGLIWFFNFGGSSFWNGGSLGGNGLTAVANMVVSMALDLTNNLGWMSVDGTNWSYAGNPATGTTGKAGGWSTATDTVRPMVNLAGGGTSVSSTLRTSRTQFTHTIPTGFAPWAND